MKKFIYFPVNKNGEGLKDSRGKVRFYKDILTLVKSCKHRNYDYVEVYAKDDILSREECESGCIPFIKDGEDNV